MRPVSLELYDQFGHNQQIGTTDNDLTFFSHPSPLIERCKVGLAKRPQLIEPLGLAIVLSSGGTAAILPLDHPLKHAVKEFRSCPSA